MKLPDLTIQICTYKRPKEIRTTIAALLKLLHYDGGLRWLVSDDATGGTYLADLRRDFPFLQTVSTPHNSGWGANVNNGLGKINTELVFFLEDDYVLTQSLDLTPGVAALLADQSLGYLRYDGIAGHRIMAHMHEVDIQYMVPKFKQGTGMGLPGKLAYWLFDVQSRETWLYSNRPHLKHKRFHKFYGLYPVGKKLGETEQTFAHTIKDLLRVNPHAPRLGCLPEYVISCFDNIGVSFQHTEADK